MKEKLSPPSKYLKVIGGAWIDRLRVTVCVVWCGVVCSVVWCGVVQDMKS